MTRYEIEQYLRKKKPPEGLNERFRRNRQAEVDSEVEHKRLLEEMIKDIEAKQAAS